MSYHDTEVNGSGIYLSFTNFVSFSSNIFQKLNLVYLSDLTETRTSVLWDNYPDN
jgi:hypothetical protein